MNGFASRSLSALLLLTVLVTVAPSAASAVASTADRQAGLWGSEGWVKPEILGEPKLTGSGVKIAVIDEGINPDVAELQGANITVRGTSCIDPATQQPKQIVSTDPKLAEHGTNVVAMIVGNGRAADGGIGTQGVAPGAEVSFYGVGPAADVKSCLLQDPSRTDGEIDLARDVLLGIDGRITDNPKADGDATSLAARAAIRDGAQIISVSLASGDWKQVLVEAQLAGVIVVAASPNPENDFNLYQGPFLANGALPVSAYEESGDQLTDPRTGAIGRGSSMMGVAAPGAGLLGVGSDTAWEPTMVSGTSYATPLVAGLLALGMEKFPKATGFQMMQGLVRTTGNGGVHDLDWIDTHFGYGYANPRGFLGNDPTQFANENPMFVTDLADKRCSFRNGEAGRIGEQGQWTCRWSFGPFPPEVDSYKKVVLGGDKILDASGQLVDSVYSKSPEQHADESSGLWSIAMWLVVGIVLLIAVISVVVIFVSKSRKKSPSRSREV